MKKIVFVLLAVVTIGITTLNVSAKVAEQVPIGYSSPNYVAEQVPIGYGVQPISQQS